MKKHLNTILWFAAFILGLGTVFIRAAFPEPAWMTGVALGGFLICLMGLLFQYRKELQSRSGAHGLQSVISAVIIILIVGVLNFLATRYHWKKDLTKNQIHTLSEQTKKIVKNLPDEVKFSVFAKPQRAEELKDLVENYKSLNSKLKVEIVNPERELTRAKNAGIKRDGTIVLQFRNKDSKVEEPTEEKLTNALIKILKDRNQTLCALTGHNEKNFSNEEGEGYGIVRKELNQQSYDVKDINVFIEGKIPQECDAIAIIGPSKAFFPKEVTLIKDYLEQGGRAIFALDFNFRSTESSSDMIQLLKEWMIEIKSALIVDPVSKMVNVEPVVAVLSTFSKEHPVTAETQASSFFPFSRPLEISATPVLGLKAAWLAKTMPSSWAESDLTELKTGAVKMDEGKDQKGPLTVAAAVSGKKNDKNPKASRIVVFATSMFATNYWARFGGNLDFFLNAVSWALEDESLISIRSKSEEPTKIEMTPAIFTLTWLSTVLVFPLLTAVAGIVIWVRRKKL